IFLEGIGRSSDRVLPFCRPQTISAFPECQAGDWQDPKTDWLRPEHKANIVPSKACQLIGAGGVRFSSLIPARTPPGAQSYGLIISHKRDVESSGSIRIGLFISHIG